MRCRSLPRPLWSAGFAAGVLLAASTVAALAQDLPQEGSAPEGIDWSVGLRGAYDSSSLTGGKAEAIIAPHLRFTRSGERDQTTLSSGGEFSVDTTGAVRIDELRLGGSSAYDLDQWSKLHGSVDLSLVQLPADDSSLPSGTAVGPTELTGTAQGDASRKLGRFDVTGRLKGERFVEGPTLLEDKTSIDNTDQSYWLGEAGLRVGYELSPLLSVFVDGSESYQKFDAAEPSLGKFLDGRTTELKGGFSYALPGTLSAEVSAGRAWLDYTDAAITDQPGWVYDASVTLTPDETLSLTGAFNTSIGPSTDTIGDTDIVYALNGSASYLVNPWLTLRGTAAWNRTQTVGSGAVGWGYSAGAGLDLQSSRHVIWSADYLFNHSEPATTPVEDTHTVTVGVTFKR